MKTTYNPARNKDGVIIEQLLSGGGMLDGGFLQDPHERSTVQNYEIGTRLVMDERVFRYGKSISDLTQLTYALINSHIIPTDGFEGAIVGTAKAGSRLVTIADQGAAGARPKDYYAGAYFLSYYNPTTGVSETNFDQQRRVVSSTVGNGVSITLTLDYPLTCDVTATCDVYPSQYSEVAACGAVSSGEETFIGYAAAYLQALEYGWFQTWGPVNGHYNIKFPGETGGAGDRDCYFNASGEIQTLKQTGSDAYISFQRAGYVIPVTKSAYGSVMIMLQLAP